MAPSEICILIYLSYILYISKFFIPLRWLHASFMASSAVFAGQIQATFYMWGCSSLAPAVPPPWKIDCLMLLIFTPHTTIFFLFGAVSVLKVATHLASPPTPQPRLPFFWFVSTFKIAPRSISVTWKRLFFSVEDEWLTQLGDCGNDATTQVKANFYLWSIIHDKGITDGRVSNK